MRCILIVGFLAATCAAAQERPRCDREIDFHAMTSAEQTAARREAKRRTFDQLTFCADPGNMPLSNNRAEGLQNRIAAVVAEKMGARLSYFWRPFFERGLTRETFDNRECEIIIEVPFGYERILTSMPIYRSTYVFATRADSGVEISGFDDPVLREARVGVFQHSGMREALARHGIKEGLDLHILSYDADLKPEKQPWNQVRKVAEGELDVAGVWGPFAGWVKAQGAALTLTPANLMEDQVPLEFDMAFGVRTNDVVLKYALDFALMDAQDEIKAILQEFGVPLVECARCAVSGDLPAHGGYFEDIIERAQERFTTVREEGAEALDLAAASTDQIMTVEKLKADLAAGADMRAEFINAVTASDQARVGYLLEQGADPDLRDKLGATPLVTAAVNRDTRMLDFLISRGADPNRADINGMTPLAEAVLRNHAPSVTLLAQKGADLAAPGPGGAPPLALALSEGMRWAAVSLLEAGASPDQTAGRDALTPLMIVATQDRSHGRAGRVIGGPSPVSIAEMLVEKGADVNARSAHGVTPLMIAAGHDNADMLAFLLKSGADPALTNDQDRTALQIAELARAKRSAQALRVLAR